MNREIKFRAWDDKYKYMYCFDLVQYMTSNEFDQNDLCPCSVNNLMQYTGLKDKNGKEIYEGDILRLTQWNPEVYKVIFERGAFCFVDINKSEDDYPKDCKYLEEGIVIGNIYENENLINN